MYYLIRQEYVARDLCERSPEFVGKTREVFFFLFFSPLGISEKFLGVVFAYVRGILYISEARFMM